MPRVFLVNPALTSLGYGIMTPRWLFVIAQATPKELVENPVIIDESIEKFDPSKIGPKDIVGLGMTTSNCAVGYRHIKAIKERGATVIVGGIHATIFPEEPLEFGADAVVTGNGDNVWRKAVEDALNGKLQKVYAGGRVPGDQLLPADWSLLDPRNYLIATVQTIAGCPENCSFCSVWVTDGRKPRQRLTDKIIGEVNELYRLGFRFIAFADDNFNPGTLGRIAREKSPEKQKEFHRIREERLKFFEEYDRSVPKDIYGLTQMTSEIATDPEYLEAAYTKMRIRGVLVGVESFSQAGLKRANKEWNPVGDRMIEALQTIRNKGILVLSSLICGLESDNKDSLIQMRDFAIKSGTDLAQFVIYSPYPGTVDLANMKKAGNTSSTISLKNDRFWLDIEKPTVMINHPHLSDEVLVEEVGKSWQRFYSLRQLLKRAASPRWGIGERFRYILISLAFRLIYLKNGVSADHARRQRPASLTGFIIRTGARIYNYLARRTNPPQAKIDT